MHTLTPSSVIQEVKEFYKAYDAFMAHYMIDAPKIGRNRPSRMPRHHVLAIIILFHDSGHKHFRVFYEMVVMRHLGRYVRRVSYSWFIRLRNRYMIDLLFFLVMKQVRNRACYYIDSTAIKVCHNRRIAKHKTFQGLAERGKTSMGWFFGFKVHLLINEQGELVKFMISKGNVDDREGLKMAETLNGILCGDKGYISAKWLDYLKEKGVSLTTRVRKNMKSRPMSDAQKRFLRSRGVIETVIGRLKLMGLFSLQACVQARPAVKIPA